MDVDLSAFMSRNGLAAMWLARRLVGLAEGEQLPRARDMAAELGFGNGTVQAGLQLLEGAGAIATTSRGRLGTFLDHADRALLWELGGLGPVSVAMPLPYTRRYEGLASGLRCAFDRLRVPLALSFMRGSSERIDALVAGRVDLVVASGLAVDRLAEESPVAELIDLGPRTYVSEHGVVLAAGRSVTDTGLRVAVDRASADQVDLVDRVFGTRTDIHRLDTSYNQLAARFDDGSIDATVWNVDEIERHVSVPVTVEPLDRWCPPGGRNTRAVLVGAEQSPRVPAGLLAHVDLDLVRAVQDEVLHGRRLPAY